MPESLDSDSYWQEKDEFYESFHAEHGRLPSLMEFWIWRQSRAETQPPH